MGRQIATFLDLPNSDHYGILSVELLLVVAGGDITALKRHEGCKSTAGAEDYNDNSIKNAMDTCQNILQSMHTNNLSTKTANQNLKMDVKTPNLNITKYTNFDICYHPISSLNKK